ncbi:hypothetical protein GCM10009646_75010 [Streptomyces aureus]
MGHLDRDARKWLNFPVSGIRRTLGSVSGTVQGQLSYSDPCDRKVHRLAQFGHFSRQIKGSLAAAGAVTRHYVAATVPAARACAAAHAGRPQGGAGEPTPPHRALTSRRPPRACPRPPGA